MSNSELEYAAMTAREKVIYDIENNPSQMVEFRSLKYKERKCIIKPVYSRYQNEYLGIGNDWEERIKQVGASGVQTPESEFELRDGAVLNLAKPMERNRWAWIKHHPKVAMSLQEAKGMGRDSGQFVIHIEGREEKRLVARQEKVINAQYMIKNESDTELRYKAQLVTSEDMGGFLPDQIKQLMYETAAKNPDIILSVFADPDLQMKVLLQKAKQKGTIRMEDGIWKYGETLLGATDDGILEFMKRDKNVDITRLITMSVNSEYYKQDDINSFQATYLSGESDFNTASPKAPAKRK
jgi:hypothetical protein